MRRIYMDANATTPVLPEVVEAMHPCWSNTFGNASSIHQPGQTARAAVDHARDSIARMLHCRPAEIVFTSGGTESDNLALFGPLTQPSTTGEPAHLIVSAIEHEAVLQAAHALEARGVQLTLLPSTAEGIVTPESLRDALRPNTRLVSIMLANNETGVIQPIAELAAIAHAARALFHTDAVQAAGKLPLDVNALGCDLLTLSGHKMYAPQGTGVLYARRSVRLSPILFGGRHERGRRAGTENVPGIVALGRAAELALEWLAAPNPVTPPQPTRPAPNPNALAQLRDRLEQGILAGVEQAGINGGSAPRVSNTTNLFFDHLDAEALVIALDLKGLAISGGSACQSGATEPSHVLTAMGSPELRARASIRISLTRFTTEDEVDIAIALVRDAVTRLRAHSPTWNIPAAQTATAG